MGVVMYHSTAADLDDDLKFDDLKHLSVEELQKRVDQAQREKRAQLKTYPRMPVTAQVSQMILDNPEITTLELYDAISQNTPAVEMETIERTRDEFLSIVDPVVKEVLKNSDPKEIIPEEHQKRGYPKGRANPGGLKKKVESGHKDLDEKLMAIMENPLP
jgi:hypothetical protein